MRYAAAGLLLYLATCGPVSSPARAELVLVERGQARSVIVLPAEPLSDEREAAADLQYHIRRASGAELPVVDEREAAAVAPGTVRIALGATRLAASLGVDPAGLLPEQCRILTAPNTLVLAAHVVPGEEVRGRKRPASSPGVRFAVSHLLDRQLGVRWLWPGELGTVVPPQETIAVGPLDVTARPDLQRRKLRMHLGTAHNTPETTLLSDRLAGQLADEAAQWGRHHMLGSRSEFGFGHSFGAWWNRFHATHPEYFAHPPEGQKQPYPHAGRVKLCVSHPAVAEQIVADWLAAGKPDNWNVCPNDSRGFCVCDRCRALDGIEDQSPEGIWRDGDAVITGRYVDLWNRLLRKMKPLNPEVTLSSYAYSQYRRPLPEMKLEDGIVLGIVDAGYSRDDWQAWHDAGAMLFLRPNWWHAGGAAPNLPLHRQGEFFRFAREHAMVGFDFDSLIGYWGTQGPLYYLIARLASRPDLTVDAVLNEYASGFGQAAPAIRRYLDYWEAYTEKCRFVAEGEESPFEKARRELGLGRKASRDSHMVLPLLYGENVLAPAEALLAEAARLAAGDSQAVARIAFLRDGLAHLRANRDLVATAFEGGRNRKPAPDDLRRRIDALMQFRAELSPRHVVWGESLNLEESKRGVRFDRRTKATVRVQHDDNEAAP